VRTTAVVARFVNTGELRETILVVNEDPTAGAVLSDLLRAAGYATREAASGFEALAAARETPPSAVLLDVTLPGMNGYDLCRSLREQFGEELPIIFVSGDRTEPLDRVAGLLIGADDYVVEPFAAEELVARVRRSVERAKSVRREPPQPRHLGPAPLPK
jgi:DNA-binding response OmpR family regulator